MGQPKKRQVKYVAVGLTITIFNFGVYTLLARVIFNNNDLLWLATLIGTGLAAILAFFLHSKITWKERPPKKSGVAMFFVWNGIMTFALGPFLTWFFRLFTPVYELAHNISSFLRFPFSYEFVESTGVFVFASLVVMVLNYMFYDKLVFGSRRSKKTDKNMVK